MKTIALALVLVVSAAGAATLLASHRAPEPSFAPPENLPRGDVELLEAVPFVLDEPYEHEWRAEHPLVSAGFLVALRVDPDLARPRQTFEAVLYCGEETVERCNAPEDGGVLIGIVPSTAGADGRVQLDLARAPLWFGGLELPERVDAARIGQELALARGRGVGPARRSAGTRLRTAATETLRLRTREDLSPYVADWIERWSPEETALVSQLRRVGTDAGHAQPR